MIVEFLCCLAVAMMPVLGVGATVTPDDVDLPSCKIFQSGALVGVGDTKMRAILFESQASWRPKLAAGNDAPVEYVIAFRRAVPVGTVMALDVDEIAIRKTDAANAWMTVPIVTTGGGRLRLAPLPPNTMVRGIRLTQSWKNTRNKRRQLNMVRLPSERLVNVAPEGVANADGALWTSPLPEGAFLPQCAITGKGRGAWQNFAPSKKVANRLPISEENPSWFILSWEEPKTLTGLWIETTASEFTLSAYEGPAGVNPKAAQKNEWRKIEGWNRSGPENAAVTFNKPITTRGLRFEFTHSSFNKNEAIVRVEGLQALSLAGAQVAVVPTGSKGVAEKPGIVLSVLSVPVPPGTGTVSVVIETPDGKRIRNLAARRPVVGGAIQLPWDFCDENGVMVAPGEYIYRSLWLPELSVKYQMTVYPNVEMTSTNSPWMNGFHGAGSWLGDHSAGSSVAIAGDHLFFSCEGAEDGVAVIKCDLEGRKQWGRRELESNSGPCCMAANSEYLYMGVRRFGSRDTIQSIYRIKVSTLENEKPFIEMRPEAKRLLGMQAIAVYQDRLYVAVKANVPSFFQNAATESDLDFNAITPAVQSNNHRRDYTRLLRLVGTPPGQKGGLTGLDSTESSDMRQHSVIAFNQPITLGSLAFPIPKGDFAFALSALKTDATSTDPKNDKNWTEFYRARGEKGWTVVPCPYGLTTRAVRATYERSGTKTTWKSSLEGAKLFARRMQAVRDGMKIRVSSGEVSPDGIWDAKRTSFICPDDPAILVMEWPTAQSVRGLAIQEVEGKRVEIDIYDGPATQPIDIASDKGWQQVASYNQRERVNQGLPTAPSNNPFARYMDGYVDFDCNITTRAIRLRVVEQWPGSAVRSDRVGKTTDKVKRGAIFGVVAVRDLGAGTVATSTASERVDIYSAVKPKTLLQTFAVPKPVDIKFAKDGTCYVISDDNVVRLNTDNGAITPLNLDVIKPGNLTIDSNGLLYVWDAATERMNIRVFNPKTRQLVRTIGSPGGYKPGPWDQTRIGFSPANRVRMAIDSNNKLWVVEAAMQCKRISRWSSDGKYEKEFLGNPRYGGGGTGGIDPWDKSRLFLPTGDCTLQFNIDWKTGASHIKNLNGIGRDGGGGVVVRAYGHEYLTPQNTFNFQSGVQHVYLLTNGISRLAASIGWVREMPSLMTREVLAKMDLPPAAYYAIWSDLNLDGKVQADEVQLFPIKKREFLEPRDRNLSFVTAYARYDVAKVLDNGVPLYKRTELEGTPFEGITLRALPDGSLVGRSGGKWVGLDAVGNVRWTWKTSGFSNQACWQGKRFYDPDESVAESVWCGAEQATAGDLGAFFVTCQYFGSYTIWTGDGFLAGRIFTDIRDPKRIPWNMTNHERGLELQGVTLSDEHFSGFFTRTFEDNKFYVTAGKHHVSVAEVVGLDKAKRGTGPVRVTMENVQTAIAQTAADGERKVYASAPVARASRFTPKIGGKANAWPRDGFTQLNKHARFQIAYDETSLHIRWDVNGLGPFKNSGTDYRTLYKTGAGVDLHLGADPQADARRRSPVAGDLRILIAQMADKPVAVLYKPVDPTASADLAWDSSTNVAQMRFDRVELLTQASIRVQSSQKGYTVEASIPFAALGARLNSGARIKCDVGVLEADATGTRVLNRSFWANKSVQILSDLAMESRLEPAQWGWLLTDEGAK